MEFIIRLPVANIKHHFCCSWLHIAAASFFFLTTSTEYSFWNFIGSRRTFLDIFTYKTGFLRDLGNLHVLSL